MNAWVYRRNSSCIETVVSFCFEWYMIHQSWCYESLIIVKFWRKWLITHDRVGVQSKFLQHWNRLVILLQMIYDSLVMMLWVINNRQFRHKMTHNSWLRRCRIKIFFSEESEFFSGSNEVWLMTHGSMSHENHVFWPVNRL